MAANRKKYDLKFKLSVVNFAEQNSGEAAARHFSVDPKRVREWKKNKLELQRLPEEDCKRARLRGGGRKKTSQEMELALCEWIHGMRAQHIRVSRKMIRAKAKEIYATVSDSNGEYFVASPGWLDRFLNRNDFSARRRTTLAQKDARHFTEKLVNSVTFSTRMIEDKKIQERDIIAMKETAVWFDMVGSTTVDTRGARSVPLKTTGHEKSHLTVVLAAKADGTKLKPYVVFKGGIREVKAMRNISGVVVASSKNGWMNDNLTADWLQKVVGKRNCGPRLLAWDSYRCPISTATKAELKRGYNITTAVIPEGCTKYIQAPDVIWNQPFKASLYESYDNWMAGDVDKEYTAGGNTRAPARRLLVAWVLQAWDKLDTELVKKSFKVCGLTVAADGEDHLIHCFKEGEPCASGRELLAQARQEELAEVGEGEEEYDEDEEFNNNLVTMYCPFCGSRLEVSAKNCWSCGRDVRFLEEVKPAQSTTTGGGCGPSTTTGGVTQNPALQKIMKRRKRKAKERKTFPKSRVRRNIKTTAKISIGVMIKAERALKPVRGLCLNLDVETHWSSEQLLAAATKKLKDFHQDMEDAAYVLLYPDGTPIKNIPGTDTAFTIKHYKDAIGKAYQRITLYICTLKNFLSKDCFEKEMMSNTVRRFLSDTAVPPVSVVRSPERNGATGVEIVDGPDVVISEERHPVFKAITPSTPKKDHATTATAGFTPLISVPLSTLEPKAAGEPSSTSGTFLALAPTRTMPQDIPSTTAMEGACGSGTGQNVPESGQMDTAAQNSAMDVSMSSAAPADPSFMPFTSLSASSKGSTSDSVPEEMGEWSQRKWIVNESKLFLQGVSWVSKKRSL
ncbi:uncharacterized protein ACJ7VT_003510 [Polymixia lowei]